MILKCLGSGSSGNCYLLSTETETLVLDCGLPIQEIKKGLNWDISKVVGVLCSHVHTDHSKAVKNFENMGITVFSHKDMEIDFGGEHEERKHIRYGNFEINAFALTDKNGKFMHTNNDGSECPCYGFLIEHEEMGKLLYITDTELVKWRFSGINHILLGVNYSNDLITDSAKINHVLRGHMSIDTACDFVRNNNNNLRNVIMCHLSKENSDEDMFLDKMKKCFNGECFIAKRELEIPLCLTPF